MASKISPAPSGEAVADEIPTKRRRIEAVAVSHGMGTLDDNSLFAILRFLEAEDLNSFAMCSRRCREARSSPSLDQTRTGTIICLRGSSIPRIYDAISRGRWNNELYSGNRTRLRVVRLGGVEYTLGDIQRYALSNDVLLTGVTSLDLSCTPYREYVSPNFMFSLARILLNLRELDVSDVHATAMGRNIILPFCEYCSDLTRITGNGTKYCLSIDGCEVQDTAARLAEIYVDSAQFLLPWPTKKQRLEQEPTDGSQSLHMFMHCKYLERLSIKNATISCDGRVEQLPLSQEMIIKFVRHTLTLRWLRSDLTEENVTMLQQERPEVTFVAN